MLMSILKEDHACQAFRSLFYPSSRSHLFSKFNLLLQNHALPLKNQANQAAARPSTLLQPPRGESLGRLLSVMLSFRLDGLLSCLCTHSTQLSTQLGICHSLSVPSFWFVRRHIFLEYSFPINHTKRSLPQHLPQFTSVN